MQKLLICLGFFCCFQLSYGQQTNFTVTEIDSIVNHIDSFSIQVAIEDYYVHPKRPKNKIIGNGANWFYTDSTGTKLLKVVKEEVSFGSESFDSYYFYNDSLIYLFASTKSLKDTSKSTATTGRYYFQDYQLLFKQHHFNYPFNIEAHFTVARGFFTSSKVWRRRSW